MTGGRGCGARNRVSNVRRGVRFSRAVHESIGFDNLTYRRGEGSLEHSVTPLGRDSDICRANPSVHARKEVDGSRCVEFTRRRGAFQPSLEREKLERGGTKTLQCTRVTPIEKNLLRSNLIINVGQPATQGWVQCKKLLDG